MRERDVSDLVFRDLAPEAAGARTPIEGELEAELREQLDKLRAREPVPRVVPVRRGPKPSATE
jgi:hypothetical protein